MKIKLSKSNPISDRTIAEVEEVLGCRLPDSFKIFVKLHNGSQPKNNSFRINDKNSSGVNRFIPIEDIPNEKNKIEYFPSQGYPIAWAECGNYVFLRRDKDQRVFFGIMNSLRSPGS